MTPRRQQHLLNGRRVQVRDLVNAGLIEVDDKLLYKRPQAGEEHLAVVDRRGHLRTGDRTFKTLSGAASALSGTQVDGWEVWTVQCSGRSMSALRQELLEQNASDAATVSNTESIGRTRRHTFLVEAKDQADRNPLSITVRDLLAYWDERSRNPDIDEEVEADLSNYGLITDPHFTTVGLGDRVALRRVTELRATADGRPRSTEFVTDAEAMEPSAKGMEAQTTVRRVSVGSLPSALGGIESVKPSSSIIEAITRMAINDYSQLAVKTPDGDLAGAVSWRSIARARNIDPDCSLSAATFAPRVFAHSSDLIETLPVLDDDDFFLVTGPKDEISGIVTTADVVRAYKQLASPFLLVGEIDQMLRRIIEITFDSETIISACDPQGTRKLTSVTQLTIGDYQRILQNPVRWGDLDWKLDRNVFCQQLDEVRKLRNQVMHFNADPLPESIIRMLQSFITLLREYATD